MVMIIVRNALRDQIERASEGRQTVLYTAKGQPSYMNVVPLMTNDSLGIGGFDPHCAFIVSGRVCKEFFYGSYPGVIRAGELLSLPGVAPGVAMNFEYANHAARSCGPGWHLSTNAERAALMLWCRRQGFLVQGNTDAGRSIGMASEHGCRVDGGQLGDAQGDPATLTGSGPLSWRHDHTRWGIADLCGNLWEWQAGLRLVDGEIQIIRDNDAVHADLSRTSAAWTALRLTDGEDVASCSQGSAKFDAPVHCIEGNAGTPILRTRILHHSGPIADDTNHPGLMDAPFRCIRPEPGISIPARLHALGLMAITTQDGSAQVYLRNYGERIFMSGGAWYSGHNAGLDALCLSHPRTHASSTVGARPSCISLR
ncbi:hypothetical protein ThidrDRAFT_2046 [Thiorhodococcus drewsii AZ1]|uniref:Sulfatase-modifying factor enzyme domain-containing protein n=1 Tax=Thiorhodococcus drewsii AZ1 TaxID=765913 RepID=G2E183_9GAMM|nr:hypothetical protein [Thiorhodococcus drewsii]EGV31424.1 hypothetical protein ThidrDRAFT_2046 [Thiorhodococcus drewsii AZ1]